MRSSCDQFVDMYKDDSSQSNCCSFVREAGPLMLSPTGQFIVPASCPAFLLVAFISENLDEACQLLQRYKR